MLAEETIRKLWVWGLIILAILGALFLVFAIFLNRGTLTLEGNTPFKVDLGNFQTEVCSDSPCSIVLAPGEYSIQVSKEGYRNVDIAFTLPIWGEHLQQVEFEFIPSLTSLGLESDYNHFTYSEVDTTTLPDVFFREANYLTYMGRNVENGRQTLYYRDTYGGVLGDEIPATSFIREVNDYVIIPLIEDQNKIILIDQSDQRSILYVIDLIEKTRNNIVEYPIITGAKWISGTDNFIFEARDFGEVDTSIFHYNSSSIESSKLSIQTPVSNIAVINDDKIIAATSQVVSGVEEGGSLAGQLVGLGEEQATQNANTQFIDYSISDDQSRLIMSERLPGGVQGIKLNSNGNGILILSGEYVHQLQFQE